MDGVLKKKMAADGLTGPKCGRKLKGTRHQPKKELSTRYGEAREG